MSSRVTNISASESLTLSNATAIDPSLRGFCQTCSPLSFLIRVPCIPSGSWSIAIISGAVSISLIVSFIVLILLPAIRGAAIIHHIAKCERHSVGVNASFPISSISGSFQCPGPANGARFSIFIKNCNESHTAPISYAIKTILDIACCTPHSSNTFAHSQGLECPTHKGLTTLVFQLP